MFILSVTEAVGNLEKLQGNWLVTIVDFSQHTYQKTSFLSLIRDFIVFASLVSEKW